MMDIGICEASQSCSWISCTAVPESPATLNDDALTSSTIYPLQLNLKSRRTTKYLGIPNGAGFRMRGDILSAVTDYIRDVSRGPRIQLSEMSSRNL